MSPEHVIVQQPAQRAEQLFLLFHAVGDNPASMAQIGHWFAEIFPSALVISIGGPQPSAQPGGSQWFAEKSDDRSLQQRIDRVMPEFLATVKNWQQRSGIKAQATALVGFSQGASMVLEAIKANPQLAGRAIAFSGRYAQLPELASTQTTIHLIHGDQDEQIPVEHALRAAERLTGLGGDVTLDIVEDLTHAIDQRSMGLALDHLRYTVPRRYFDEALSGSTPGEGDVITLM